MAKNILIINMTRMGDLIQSTSVISGLRKQYPDAQITLLVTSIFSEFSKRIPGVDKRVIFDICQFENNHQMNELLWITVYKYLESFLNNLKLKKYDLLINLSHSKLSAFMISYLRVSNIRGFGCNGAGDRLLHDPWMQYFGIEPFNRILNPYNLVEIFTRATGSSPEDNPIRIKYDSRDDKYIADIHLDYNIKADELVVGIQAGSSLKDRRWSPKSFASLADGLVERNSAKIILFGVESEKSLAEDIKRLSKYNEQIIDLTAKTNIDQLVSWVQRCNYLVTNDTGTMHIAAAVGTNIIGLFFAHAHPFETGPYSEGNLIFQARISCAPCSYGVECNNVVCIEKVNPEYLLTMIKTHQESKEWQLPEIMKGLKEVNIYSTCLSNDRRLVLRPLIKHPLTLNDIFREIYSNYWLKILGKKESSAINSFDNDQINFDDYDCDNVFEQIDKVNKKISALTVLERLANQGMCDAEEISQLFIKNESANIQRINILAKKIEFIDKEITQVGLIHPELKPITDMFLKRKENFQGEDTLKLAIDTRKCYQSLLEESKEMRNQLYSILRQLVLIDKSRHHVAVNCLSSS